MTASNPTLTPTPTPTPTHSHSQPPPHSPLPTLTFTLTFTLTHTLTHTLTLPHHQPQDCQHWKMTNLEILRNYIHWEVWRYSPRKMMKIVDALWCILDTSVIDLYILFCDWSLHYFLLQIIRKIYIVLLYCRVANIGK